MKSTEIFDSHLDKEAFLKAIQQCSTYRKVLVRKPYGNHDLNFKTNVHLQTFIIPHVCVNIKIIIGNKN